MRSFLISLLLFTISSFAFSQKTATIYLDKYGFPVEETTEAATYLCVSDTTTGHHVVKTYNIDGTLESKGAYVDDDLFTRHGVFVTYYPNGKIKSEIEYYANSPTGTARYWYHNGQLKEIRTYDKTNVQVESFYDSLGNQMVDKGNGTYSFEEEDYEPSTKLTLVGPVRDGKKNGLFTGYRSDRTVYCKEVYKDNELVKGVSYDGEKEFKYKTILDIDFYNKWMTHLKKNLRYPATARRMGIDGTVYVRLLIDRDYNIQKALVIKSVFEDLDNETVRVLKDTDFKFGPYTKRGQPFYEAVFVAPVRFKLN